MRVLLVLVAACGATSTAPTTTVANKPAPPAPAVATCAEAAVLLRGEVDSDDKQLGPSKEVAIANTCVMSKWTPEVLSCVASAPDHAGCLAKLTEPQRAAYDTAIAPFNEDTATLTGGEEDDPPPPPPEEYVDCEEAITDVTGFATIVSKDAGDREFELALRKKGLIAECNKGWSITTRKCLTAATDPAAIGACAATLEADEAAGLKTRINDQDALIAKIAAARKKPATIECKKVVAVHYGDAMWKDKLAEQKPADKKRAIDESRKLMTAACTSEKWTATVRACVVVGGGDDCMPKEWRYPAGGVMLPLGIPECDAYGAAILKLRSCPSVPKESVDAMLDGFTQMASITGNMPAESRKAIADACKQATPLIEQMCTH